MDILQKKDNKHPSLYKTRNMLKCEDEWDTWGVDDIFNPGLYDQSFGDYLSNTRLLSIVHSILGDELRFWNAHVLWEPLKKSYDLEWHRDGVNMKPMHTNTHVLFNLALEPETSLIVLPGSHIKQLNDEESGILKDDKRGDLPAQQIVSCEVGDIVFMNLWILHRGRYALGDKRRVLHFNLQPRYEIYGGHTSHVWMREEDYLSAMPPIVAKLMKNLIEWDDSPKSTSKHIHSLRELRLKGIGK